MELEEEKVEEQDKEEKEIYKKHFFITQQLKYLDVDIQEVCKSHSGIKKWAYIIHDKDDTEPHAHIYVNFGRGSQKLSTVAKWFGVKPQYVEIIKGKEFNVLEYLCHDTNDSKSKYHYEPNEVIANYDWQTVVQESKIIGDFEKYSYAEQLNFVESLPVDEKTQAFRRLKSLWELHCEWLTLHPNRNLQVVFVCGKSGTGKTTYAKRMLDELNYDYSISSSSNDPFQDYKGQRAMILDDLRSKSFELEDLLKILDNNTNSSVKSRFNNKIFNGRMIVITTTVPLHYWYSYKRMESFDTLDQLYRRITNYIIVTKDYIQLFDGVDKDGLPDKKVCEFNNDYIKSIKSEKKYSIDLTSVIAKISKAKVDDEEMVVKENGK